MPSTPSDWQLPPGVTRGTWHYAQAPFIAADYDTYFAEHGLMQLDAAVIRRHFTRPGTVIDLGCGTGRALLPLVRAGFHGIGIDLSQAMLEVLRQKAREDGLEVECLRGNLVELGFLPDCIADYALCLFSTLGMIQGDRHRREALRQIHRIVRPGGYFVLHVHNYWHNLWLAPSRRWLLGNLVGSCLHRQTRGDKRYDYRGIRDFYLHLFTAKELGSALRSTGWQVVEWNPIASPGDRLLAYPRWCGGLRAQGWLVVCRRADGDRVAPIRA